jgi:hypothetical protein
MRAFVTNMSLCYSKAPIPVYKSMYGHNMICSFRRNKPNKMGKRLSEPKRKRSFSYS